MTYGHTDDFEIHDGLELYRIATTPEQFENMQLPWWLTGTCKQKVVWGILEKNHTHGWIDEIL